MLQKNKKTPNETKTVKVERNANDWQQIIQEAKRKELNWKYMKEANGDESDDDEV